MLQIILGIREPVLWLHAGIVPTRQYPKTCLPPLSAIAVNLPDSRSKAANVPAQIEMALSPQIAIPTMPPIPADLALAKLEFQAPIRFRLR